MLLFFCTFVFMKEIFKPVPEFEMYEVSNLGRIKSFALYPDGRILKPSVTRDGYLRTALTKDSKVKHLSIHRLVALAFIPNPENKPEVNHINGIKTDNIVDNLEWSTSSENQLHAFKTGLQTPHSNGGAKGELNSHSILSKEDVLKIRELFSSGNFKQTELADLYNVKRGCIFSIVRFRTWKHL